ncbi:MAG TPA: hypothetical protein VGU64_04975 [Terriglobales bacterium]|nr:hypothetical protein [Terriglobales bacterium]
MSGDASVGARLRPNPRYHLGALTMNTNPVLWLQAYIIGVLIFLVSVTAITEHPEWFN